MSEHKVWVDPRRRNDGRLVAIEPEIITGWQEATLTIPDPPPDPEWTVLFYGDGGMQLWKENLNRVNEDEYVVRAPDAVTALQKALAERGQAS